MYGHKLSWACLLLGCNSDVLLVTRLPLHHLACIFKRTLTCVQSQLGVAQEKNFKLVHVWTLWDPTSGSIWSYACVFQADWTNMDSQGQPCNAIYQWAHKCWTLLVFMLHKPPAVSLHSIVSQHITKTWPFVLVSSTCGYYLRTGAVLYGSHPELIRARRSRLSYGLRACAPYIDGAPGEGASSHVRGNPRTVHAAPHRVSHDNLIQCMQKIIRQQLQLQFVFSCSTVELWCRFVERGASIWNQSTTLTLLGNTCVHMHQQNIWQCHLLCALQRKSFKLGTLGGSKLAWEATLGGIVLMIESMLLNPGYNLETTADCDLCLSTLAQVCLSCYVDVAFRACSRHFGFKLAKGQPTHTMNAVTFVVLWNMPDWFHEKHTCHNGTMNLYLVMHFSLIGKFWHEAEKCFYTDRIFNAFVSKNERVGSNQVSGCC